MESSGSESFHEIQDDDYEEEKQLSSAGASKVNLKCRFYEREYPNIDELVIVEVKSVDDNGAYVQLLEYNNIEGMIMVTEYSRGRVKTLSRIIQIGKKYTVLAMRVDPEKGYIDLSKKKVRPEQAAKAEAFYKSAKAVQNIMKQVAIGLEQDLEVVNQKIAWPLYHHFEHAYDGLWLLVNDPEKVLNLLKLTKQEEEKLVENVKKKMRPQPVKIRADFEITCFAYEGIDAIKAALREGEKAAKEAKGIEVKYRLTAPPLYRCETTTLDKKAGIDAINIALAASQKVIQEKKGNYLLREIPQIIGAKEEQNFEELVEQLNQHKIASDSEEEDEGMGKIDVGGKERVKGQIQMEKNKKRKRGRARKKRMIDALFIKQKIELWQGRGDGSRRRIARRRDRNIRH